MGRGETEREPEKGLRRRDDRERSGSEREGKRVDTNEVTVRGAIEFIRCACA
jgi:hypothetical protein